MKCRAKVFTIIFSVTLLFISCGEEPLIKDGIMSNIISFRLDKAEFAQGALYGTDVAELPRFDSGDLFDYRFSYTVSVQLNTNSLKNIQSWGYVYEDPSGKKNHISLFHKGCSAVDSRVFYRNEAKSTAKLYGFVVWDDGRDFDGIHVYGEPIEYPLEYMGGEPSQEYKDTPVPVDLGLSVKWANFNVGASCAEEAGVPYAWGETVEKTEFSYYNYKWKGEWHLPKVLPLENDVASVSYGGKWRTPTKDEWQELIDNCHQGIEYVQGVKGWLFTGKNGRSIFLPILKNDRSYMSATSGPYFGCYCFWERVGIHYRPYEGFAVRAVSE